MKKAILASLFLTLGASSVALAHPGRGHRFEELDTNQDGKVTRDEMLAKHDKRFAEADTNKDGTLTEQERKASHDKRRAEHFKQRDTNGDGKLTENELERMPPGLFKKLDANGDGALTADELGRGKELHRGRMHGKGSHDGEDRDVTRDEVRSHVTKRFEKLDANRDGVLTRDELDKGPMHGRGRHGPKAGAPSAPSR